MTTPNPEPEPEPEPGSAQPTVRLATPTFLHEFRLGDIVITPQGTELSAKDAEKVRHAASISLVELRQI